MAMHLYLLKILLYLPFCHSLKEKRSVLKSILSRIRHNHNISIIEADYQDVWQSALIHIALLSNEPAMGSKQIESIKKFITHEFPDVEILKEDLEVL